jgi:hypothetical protein
LQPWVAVEAQSEHISTCHLAILGCRPLDEFQHMLSECRVD